MFKLNNQFWKKTIKLIFFVPRNVTQISGFAFLIAKNSKSSKKIFFWKNSFQLICALFLAECENFLKMNGSRDILTFGEFTQNLLRNFAKFIGKYLSQSLFFNKIAGLRPDDTKKVSHSIWQIFLYKTAPLLRDLALPRVDWDFSLSSDLARLHDYTMWL